ncbi:DNA cytosine methyltransferase [Oscillatoria sp. FACHB-1407]|uniref:DNA cytosine methyltransferase n=1 Tax=Oscillatoria sp. FACHB-1407 TaxID=2692847 RepID=UPI0016829FAA|nr:DNA cytosine methyltransferase [Oscillatoria sp. FACHB-1407]MBD2465603.1 DNA cytosine methyltransferase [Oscillatoria sp. FACHB-1407]
MLKDKRQKRIKPTVLDLFCGAGGMSLGFQSAGCEILGGVDSNPYAIKTHHKNFPDCIVKLPPTDITKLKFPKLGLHPGDVDILIGGPPCQVFSRVGIGKMRSLNRDVERDPRNFLYRYFVDALEYFQPLFFVMENVDFLEEKPIFRKIIKQLEKGRRRKLKIYPGYRVYYRVLVASQYGVPQIRKRLFIVGVREDLDVEYVFPRPSRHNPISVEEAISDLLPLTPPYIPLKEKSSGPKQLDTKKPYRCAPQSSYQELMRKEVAKLKEPDGVMNHICRAHNPVDMICFAMLGQGKKYLDLPENMRRYKWDSFDDKYKRLSWKEPSWTLTAHMRKDCLAYIHPQQNRSISVREAARIQSFPDDFVFDAPMTRMFELVGNSVPPLLARAVAKPIVKLVKHLRSLIRQSENLIQNITFGSKVQLNVI